MSEAKDWREYAENTVRELFEHPPEQAVSIIRSGTEDRVATSYFNCDFEHRWILLGHLVTDIVMEIIEVNAAEIRAMLEEENE